MSENLREIVLSIRHYGCPVSDTSADIPGVKLSTVSKISKHNNNIKSILQIDGESDDIREFLAQLNRHEVTESVDPLLSGNDSDSDPSHFVLDVAYDESVRSIAQVFSEHDCFQPATVTISAGREKWPVYVEESADVRRLADKLRDLNVSFDIQRNVSMPTLPENLQTIVGSETRQLTSRQLEVLTVAAELGYYDDENDVRMKDVAAEMDLTTATICEHLNNAENHIISVVMEKVSAGASS